MIQTVTRLGTRALAEALSSDAAIEFTRCAIGTGVFNPSVSDPRDMDGLIDAAADIGITLVRRVSDGGAVVADMNNTDVAGGTAIRELGVFATLNGGGEFLFSYGYTTEPEIVPPAEESTYERRFVTHIAMSDEELNLVVTYEIIADMLENDLAPVLYALLRAKADAEGGFVSYGTYLEAISGKLDKKAAGASGGVAQLGDDGKVPLSQLPDNMGREYATQDEIYEHFGYSASVPDDEIAEDGDVEDALAGATFEDRLFSVSESFIATDGEVRQRLQS